MSTVTKETVLACVNDTHARTHTSSVVTPAPSAILRVEIDPSAHTHTHAHERRDDDDDGDDDA